MLATLLIAVGVLVRLRLYFADLSLWRDEAALALNIIHKSFTGLMGRLDYDQGAPVGFLMIQKLVVTCLGGGEMALRLWPVAASILTIPIFFFVCYRIVGARGAIFALAFLAFAANRGNDWADNKQYSTDCFIAALLLLLAAPAVAQSDHPLSPSRLRALAIGGALAIWFSHPSVFVLAGIFIALSICWLDRRIRPNPTGLFLLAAAWGASFLLNYFLLLRKLAGSSYLQHYWGSVAGDFAPLYISLDAITWYKRALLDLFSNFSVEFEALAAVLFFLGLVQLYRRGRHLAALVVVPLLAALAASALHQYPFEWRLLMFAFPFTTMTVAAGLEFFKGQTRFVQYLALVMLLISPLSRTAAVLKHPEPECDMRGEVAFVAKHYQNGDAFYLFQSARYDFAYYQPRFGLSGVPVVVSPELAASFDQWAQEFSQFRNKRVWVMEEDPFVGDLPRESVFAAHQNLAADVLDAVGKCLYKGRTFNEFAACYDLTGLTEAQFGPMRLKLVVLNGK